MLQPDAAPESSLPDAARRKSKPPVPVIATCTWYLVFAASVAFAGALNVTVPPATVPLKVSSYTIDLGWFELLLSKILTRDVAEPLTDVTTMSTAVNVYPAVLSPVVNCYAAGKPFNTVVLSVWSPCPVLLTNVTAWAKAAVGHGKHEQQRKAECRDAAGAGGTGMLDGGGVPCRSP